MDEQKPKEEVVVKPAPQAVPPKPAGPTILFIEDDPLLLKMYKTKFESEGFSVLSAEDGEVGLEKALAQKVDLMILDIMLPKLSGLDMLAKFRTDVRGKNVPVIVLTNLTHETDVKRAMELGAKEFIVKADFTPSEVVQKIKEYLGK